MKVYRIYEFYHSTDESGTIEYGIFSSKEKAIETLKQICKEKRKKGERWIFCKKRELPYLFYNEGWDTSYVSIEKYELDKKITRDIIGYT